MWGQEPHAQNRGVDHADPLGLQVGHNPGGVPEKTLQGTVAKRTMPKSRSHAAQRCASALHFHAWAAHLRGTNTSSDTAATLHASHPSSPAQGLVAERVVTVGQHDIHTSAGDSAKCTRRPRHVRQNLSHLRWPIGTRNDTPFSNCWQNRAPQLGSARHLDARGLRTTSPIQDVLEAGERQPRDSDVAHHPLLLESVERRECLLNDLKQGETGEDWLNSQALKRSARALRCTAPPDAR